MSDAPFWRPSVLCSLAEHRSICGRKATKCATLSGLSPRRQPRRSVCLQPALPALTRGPHTRPQTGLGQRSTAAAAAAARGAAGMEAAAEARGALTAGPRMPALSSMPSWRRCWRQTPVAPDLSGSRPAVRCLPLRWPCSCRHSNISQFAPMESPVPAPAARLPGPRMRRFSSVASRQRKDTVLLLLSCDDGQTPLGQQVRRRPRDGLVGGHAWFPWGFGSVLYTETHSVCTPPPALQS